MKYVLKVRRKAQRDISQAVDWYNIQQKGLGKRFAREVRTVISRIEDNPHQFPAVFLNVHRATCKVFPYSVFFDLDFNTIEILSVFPTRQNPEKLPY
jgi:plasmid stabilization system protein ParE